MRKLTVIFISVLIVVGLVFGVDSFQRKDGIAKPQTQAGAATLVQDRQKQLKDWEAKVKMWQAQTQKNSKPSNSPPQSAGQQTPSGGTLPNTGPNQAINLFVIVSLLGGPLPLT